MAFRKWIATLLAATTCFGLVACKETEKAEGSVPDYSTYTQQFDFYCYAPPNDGTWIADDGSQMYSGEDFRTVEKYKEYKDCGFDILMIQFSGNYYGQDWETSDTKMVMDRAYEAGIKKIIVTDSRFLRLSVGTVNVDEKTGEPNPLSQASVTTEGGIIGEDKPFANEAELDAYVAECLAPYKDYPGFYGVQLKDEPVAKDVIPYGQVYRSIKRVCPNAFVQYNLLQIFTDKASYENTFPVVEGTFADETEEGAVRYRKYLEEYLDHTGADYIMWDSYPLRGSVVRENYILNMQITAQLCKERGVRFANTTQTESEIALNGSTVKMRAVTEEGARWLNNMLLGFGVKQIVYYTYFNKGRENDSIYPDGTSFITHYGEKTDLYYFMQKIIAEDQKFAPTILNFDYVTSNVYNMPLASYSVNHVLIAEKGNEFQRVSSVSINKECALVTELYDDENERYMYMVQNVVDPKYKGSKSYQTATVTFKGEYTHALVYVNGEATKKKLDGGKLVIKQHPGEAAFILPY